MSSISLKQLQKIYSDGTKAVDGVDVEIADGEFIVLVGPSGCGKTSVLRMIAGLEEVSGGEIHLGDVLVNDLPPRDRDIAMVFQTYALYPHMSVYDNMAFGLKLRGLAKPDIRRRVAHAAEVLGLGEVLRKRPRTLSGGQRQRVAMGRAIVRQPAAFLMDEPLSNLDAQLRVHMRAEIARLQRNLGVTTIYVTHDQSEAMTLGDRVCVMRHGLIDQLDAPKAIYDRPANLFVAEFIGSPSMNVIRSTLHMNGEGPTVNLGAVMLRVPEALLAERPGLHEYLGRDVVLGIRPEDFEDAAFVDSGRGCGLTVGIDLREEMGAEVYVHFAIDGRLVKSQQVVDAEGDSLDWAAPADRVPFVARVSRATNAREGAPLDLAVDTTKLHFFDPSSGDAIYG